jgi:hypothetical protein
MMKHFFNILFLALFMSACVSVNLPGSKVIKSKDVSFKSPDKPFKSSQSPNSDEIWESTNTASTISYYSSCSENEPSLKSILSSSLQGLENFKILKEDNIQINEREGINSVVEGQLEGVPVKLQVIVFKKNSCSYHLTYVALKENFDKEVNDFNNFRKNFSVK